MKPLDKPIYVTQTYLPPKEEYMKLLDQIWESHCLTNNGKFHQQLEEEFKRYLGVDEIVLFTNGHLALESVLQVYKLEGEVITTPFTFASTTHAIVRNGLKPVFADIQKDHFTIDPKQIEKLITPKTAAILPVHVFGYVCDVESIEEIGRKYGIKVIYDAAHAFGVKYKGKPIGCYGDASMFSMHATKVYQTIEGGAVACNESNKKELLEQIKNFGIIGPEEVVRVGMNAKMNEFQAAMGLVNLKYLNSQINKRKKLVNLYRENLKSVSGIRFLEDDKDTQHNYAYMPILVDEAKIGITRDALYEELKGYNIYTRKYFYPLITSFECYKEIYPDNHLIQAKKVAQQILTLPLYSEMGEELVSDIVEAIKEIIDNEKARGR